MYVYIYMKYMHEYILRHMLVFMVLYRLNVPECTYSALTANVVVLFFENMYYALENTETTRALVEFVS